MEKPRQGDYSEYFGRYISKVGEDIFTKLEKTYGAWHLHFPRVNEENSLLSYADGKWNVRQVLQHIIDTEQVMAYRALRIARGDETPLPSFSQDNFAANDFSNEMGWQSIVERYQAQRPATINLMRSFPDKIIHNAGEASKTRVSVSALCHIIAGHDAHHLEVFEKHYLPLL